MPESTIQTSIYGAALPQLERTRKMIVGQVEVLRIQMRTETGLDPVDHCLSRIKTEKSMREKCRAKGLPETAESALEHIHDAVGVRVVCPFLSDVYAFRDHLSQPQGITVVQEKDYIRDAKPNGYRSFHLIVQTQDKIYAEVQLRTISMDTWAALEHHLKYKRTLHANQRLIVSELKRCADELAATDVSMQTIRDMIVSQEG